MPDKQAGQQVGYIRVSSIDQNTIRQLDGLSLDKIFTEKMSGKDIQRPVLQECLAYIRDGDVARQLSCLVQRQLSCLVDAEFFTTVFA